MKNNKLQKLYRKREIKKIKSVIKPIVKRSLTIFSFFTIATLLGSLIAREAIHIMFFMLSMWSICSSTEVILHTLAQGEEKDDNNDFV